MKILEKIQLRHWMQLPYAVCIQNKPCQNLWICSKFKFNSKWQRGGRWTTQLVSHWGLKCGAQSGGWNTQILYHCPLEAQDYWTIFGKCVWVCVYVSVWVGVCMRALGGVGGSNRIKGRNDDLVIRVLDPQSRDLRFKTTGWLPGRLSLSFFQGQLNEYHDVLGALW